MPPTLPLLRQPTTRDIREQLHRLEVVAQELQTERTNLEHQLRSVHERTTFNDAQIRHIMAELDERLFKEHRSHSQPDFRRGVIANDIVIDGICAQMRVNPQLKTAVEAISKNSGTVADNNLLLMAILNQLSGDPYHFAHHLALRVVEYDQVKEKERQKLPLLPLVTSDLPASVNPYLIATGAEHASTQAARGPSVIPLLSPSIKSEPNSTANPYNGASTLPNGTASGLDDNPSRVSALVTAVPLADQGRIVAHGMSTLQKNFPGLLESMSKPVMPPRIKPTPPAAGAGAPAVAGAKRSDPSPSPGVVRPGKKARLEKEAAIAHTFVLFMKQLEQLHQGSQAITDCLKCSRCLVIKRDVRVLNCLHLYCHRCILQLRTEAAKGDPIRGFNSFCVKPDCKQVVSGKTTVIDPEIMDFLQWYDKQPAGITSLPAQLNVLCAAAAKYPEDDEIKHKWEQAQLQYNALRAGNALDMPCDLMQMAKLVRKPY
ncbi:hypothetical protein CLAIMM_11293 [Cladophialophora immunda]|nr:hypothetical protein CLAIMM_11293 [Cladophialophora immunda]